jgi:hypothetical protein
MFLRQFLEEAETLSTVEGLQEAPALCGPFALGVSADDKGPGRVSQGSNSFRATVSPGHLVQTPICRGTWKWQSLGERAGRVLIEGLL